MRRHIFMLLAIRRCCYVQGFFSKYFEGKCWSVRAYQRDLSSHVICRWSDFLNPPVQNMRQEATGSLIAPSTPLSPANLRRCATIASPASRDPRRVDLYPVRNAKLNASSPFRPSIIQSISKLQHCRSQTMTPKRSLLKVRDPTVKH